MDKTYREFSTFWLTELDFCHHGKSLGVDERAITWDLRKLENFKKITETLGMKSKFTAGHPKRIFGKLYLDIARNYLCNIS